MAKALLTRLLGELWSSRLLGLSTVHISYDIVHIETLVANAQFGTHLII